MFDLSCLDGEPVEFASATKVRSTAKEPEESGPKRSRKRLSLAALLQKNEPAEPVGDKEAKNKPNSGKVEKPNTKQAVAETGATRKARDEAVQVGWTRNEESKSQEMQEAEPAKRRLPRIFKSPFSLLARDEAKREEHERKEEVVAMRPPAPRQESRRPARQRAGWLSRLFGRGTSDRNESKPAGTVYTREPKVAVVGKVANPGLYPVGPNGATLQKLIQWAGGIKAKDDELLQVTIVRMDESKSDETGTISIGRLYYEQFQAPASHVANMLLEARPQEIVIIGWKAANSTYIAVMPQFILQLPRGARKLSAKQVVSILKQSWPNLKNSQVGLLASNAIAANGNAEKTTSNLSINRLVLAI